LRGQEAGTTGCPETLVRNYLYSLRNNPEERSSHLVRGGSLKSSNDVFGSLWSHSVPFNGHPALMTLNQYKHVVPAVNYAQRNISSTFDMLLPVNSQFTNVDF
jgi:hypothetical protein